MAVFDLSEAEKAYLAGLIDGEGSISLCKSFAARTNGRYIYPLVRLCNTDLRLIDWVSKRFSSGSRGYKTKTDKRYKNVIHLAWACSDAIEVLQATVPYLVAKKERAEIVLRLNREYEHARLEAGGYFGNGHPLPDAIMASRLSAFAAMQRLNVRGNHAAH